MANGVTTEVATRDGRAVVRKVATEAQGVARLHREAERLRRARHPGVVELVGEATGDEEAELLLAWAGGQTIETVRPGIAAATALLASIASTVADLHQLGLVHGRLDATHVVVDALGRPRLCGLAGPDPDDQEPGAADDVAALGHLIDRLVGGGAEAEPIPEHRWARRRWTGFQVRALQTLADQATATEPERRPSARSLAASLRDLAPDARIEPLPGGAPPARDGTTDVVTGADPEEAGGVHATAPATDARGEAPEPVEGVGPATFLGMRIAEGLDAEADLGARRRTRPPGRGPVAPAPASGPNRSPWSRTGVRAAAVAVGLGVLVVGLLHLRPGADGVATAPQQPPSPASATTGASASGSTGSTAAPPTPTTPPTPSTACTEGAEGDVDVDGDGCPDQVRIVGSTITVGRARYAIGRPEDRVALGDWDCDGTATPAVLRPSTGEVFVFAAWPTTGDPVTRTPTATFVGGAELQAADPQGCGHLAVRFADDTAVEVPLGDGGPS